MGEVLTREIEKPVVSPRPVMPAASVPQAPLLSLILATYGRSDVLGPMLASLASQTWRGFELIVVDQNDDDRVVPFLEPIRRSGIVVTHLKTGAPNLSAARNRGVEAAAGPWVAFPDDDCWYEPDCLAHVAEAIGTTASVDGWVIDWVESRQAAAAGQAGIAAAPFEAGIFRAFRGGDASSITLFLKTAVVREVEAFDARIGVGRYYGAGEETDLMIRLLDHGAVIRRLPQARVHHHYGSPRPVLSRVALMGILRRERGVGALYSKHRLKSRVIARGLLAPLARALTADRPVHGVLTALATVVGRITGMVRWRRAEPAWSPTGSGGRLPAAPELARNTSPTGTGSTVPGFSDVAAGPAIAVGYRPVQGERMSDESNRQEREGQ